MRRDHSNAKKPQRKGNSEEAKAKKQKRRGHSEEYGGIETRYRRRDMEVLMEKGRDGEMERWRDEEMDR
jgi:hypothetical protein